MNTALIENTCHEVDVVKGDGVRAELHRQQYVQLEGKSHYVAQNLDFVSL